MSFLKNIFGGSGKKISSNKEFWDWFGQNQSKFAESLRNNRNVQDEFIVPVNTKLNELRQGYSFLAGRDKEGTLELIITPDGIVQNAVFCEELVKVAPTIPGWTFLALKRELDITNVNIEMGGAVFGRESLSFYPSVIEGKPDIIEICVVHNQYDSKKHDLFFSGTCIFLDNYLGEIRVMTMIDNLKVEGPGGNHPELIPIEKLKDYLIWREKEFVEKYSGSRRDTDNDAHSTYEAELGNGTPYIAVINTDAINWDAVASHPWILQIESGYNGSKNNGLPDDATYQQLVQMEEALISQLKDADGYINVGRETGDNSRITYFACKEFRKPVLVAEQISKQFGISLDIKFEMFKDKYWQTFDRFRSN